MKIKDAFRQKYNKTLFLFVVSLTICFFTIQSQHCFGEEKLSEKDRQRLLSYINTYDSQKFINDPVVQSALKHHLGNELAHLERNVSVHGPIGIISGILYIAGNAPHQGGEEHGFLGIKLHDGSVYAALYTKGRIEVFGKAKKYAHLPDGVRHWILMTWAYSNLNGKMPPNVELRTNNQTE